MLLLQSATAHEHSFRQSGTLQSWQENVARYAAGNSRLVLALLRGLRRSADRAVLG